MFPNSYFPQSFFPPNYWEKTGAEIKGGHGSGAGGIRSPWVLAEIARRLREWQVVAEKRAQQNIMARLMRHRMEFDRSLEMARLAMVRQATTALLLAEV